MTAPILRDAFGHHAWATLRILDVAATLGDEQLATVVPGTYGSILETLRHLVDSDGWYLSRLDPAAEPVDAESLSVAELRGAMERNARGWERLVEAGFHPDEVVVVDRDDGSQARSRMSMRIAQVLHHGTDHRSQICTALTTLGVESPAIDVWDYGLTNGGLVVTEASG